MSQTSTPNSDYESTLDASELLLEYRRIEALKYAYMRCLDTKEWDEMADLLTEDAIGEWSGGKLTRTGKADILAFFRESMDSREFLSAHHAHQPELRLLGPDAAVGTWALEDTVIMGEYSLLLHGSAIYHDEYRREGGRWKIARTGYQRTFEYILPTTTLPGYQLTASRWGTDGKSTLV